MRALAVLALLSAAGLAGCTQGSPGGDDPFEPTCPAWIKSLSTAEFTGPGWFHPNGTNTDAWDTNETRPMGVTQWDGRPLDWVEFDFHVKRDRNGTAMLDRDGSPRQQFLLVEKGLLQVQFIRADNGGLLLAYDSSKGPPGPKNPPSETLTWEAGLYTNFTIRVDLSSPHEPPAPTPFFAHWTLFGPRTGNGDVSAWAYRDTTVYSWYRTCNADGSAATV